MKLLLNRLESLVESKKTKISMISYDDYGNFAFLVDDAIYDGTDDAAVVLRMAKKAKRQPGAAFNILKNRTTLHKRGN